MRSRNNKTQFDIYPLWVNKYQKENPNIQERLADMDVENNRWLWHMVVGSLKNNNQNGNTQQIFTHD